ncbi:uncharacterized protein [Haliotis asinina]|uniref:uncharacterized protein n=1 Tax=Haliotis asinina TaxID=109174 RepID=UPI003531BAEF
MTGLCDGGCSPGWKGVDCTTECVHDVEYGAGCVGNCSARMCDGGSGNCHRGTGRCDAGCQFGWTGVDCGQREVSSLSPVTSISPEVAGVFGAVMMLLVLAVVEGVVCLCRKGDFRMGKRTPREQSGTPGTSHSMQSNPIPLAEVPAYDVLPEHDYTKLDGIHTEHYDTLRSTVDYHNSDVRVQLDTIHTEHHDTLQPTGDYQNSDVGI